MIMLLETQMERLQVENYPILSQIFQVKRQNMLFSAET